METNKERLEYLKSIYNIQNECGTLLKANTVAAGSKKYNYVSLEDILNKLKPLMQENKIIFNINYQASELQEINFYSGASKTNYTRQAYQLTINYSLTHLNGYEYQNKVVVPMLLAVATMEGKMNESMMLNQNNNSILTYHTRYILLKEFNITTVDESDNDADNAPLIDVKSTDKPKQEYTQPKKPSTISSINDIGADSNKTDDAPKTKEIFGDSIKYNIGTPKKFAPNTNK